MIRRALVGLSDAATRGFMTEDTVNLLRSEFPGWDLYTLYAEFEVWTKASSDRTPANWQKALSGGCAGIMTSTGTSCEANP